VGFEEIEKQDKKNRENKGLIKAKKEQYKRRSKKKKNKVKKRKNLK